MKNNKGQILLITVMILATVMTIVLSISFKSATETQVTKLEEESQKALSAAESAIDVALKTNSTATLGPGGSQELATISGFSGSATIDVQPETTQFTSPTIVKDGSYTFYLGTYNPITKQIADSNGNSVTICFHTAGAATIPAIEVTLVKSNEVKKYVIDPSNRIESASLGTFCSNNNYVSSFTIPGGDIETESKFLLVRVLYSPTKLLFISESGINLPVQGRTVSSQATSSTSTGVSKKIVLFQSYPQIPAEFFTTTF